MKIIIHSDHDESIKSQMRGAIFYAYHRDMIKVSGQLWAIAIWLNLLILLIWITFCKSLFIPIIILFCEFMRFIRQIKLCSLFNSWNLLLKFMNLCFASLNGLIKHYFWSFISNISTKMQFLSFFRRNICL